MAGMHKGPEEGVQNYGMRIILSQPPRSPSEKLRGRLKRTTLERRRVMGRMILVQRCVLKKAPQCLNDRLRTNAKVGNRMTRGYDKLFLP